MLLDDALPGSDPECGAGGYERIEVRPSRGFAREAVLRAQHELGRPPTNVTSTNDIEIGVLHHLTMHLVSHPIRVELNFQWDKDGKGVERRARDFRLGGSAVMIA